MATTTIDTLGYFEKLKAVGIPENQAKAQIEVLREVIEDRLATKQDIKDLRVEMKEIEYRLTIRLGAMIAASVATVAVLVKLL